MYDENGNPILTLPNYTSNLFQNNGNNNSVGGFSNYFQAPSADNGWNVNQVNPTFDVGTTTTTQGANSGGMFSNFFNNPNGGTGWGTQAISAATGVAQSYLGYQQLKAGEEQNRINNNQWQAQFDIQKSEYDRQVKERNARVAANNAAKANAGGV